MSNNTSRGLNGLKILVVDDSKTIRRTAETLLSKEGCQVFTAIDGFDALSKIADHQPDLIFVDIMMSPGRLPDVLIDQAQQDIQEYTGHHVVE